MKTTNIKKIGIQTELEKVQLSSIPISIENRVASVFKISYGASICAQDQVVFFIRIHLKLRNQFERFVF